MRIIQQLQIWEIWNYSCLYYQEKTNQNQRPWYTVQPLDNKANEYTNITHLDQNMRHMNLETLLAYTSIWEWALQRKDGLASNGRKGKTATRHKTMPL